MAEITAALVKELRERTGEGMMDCKKALTKAGGDIEIANDKPMVLFGGMNVLESRDMAMQVCEEKNPVEH